MKRTLVRLTSLTVITALLGFGGIALARNASVKQFFAERKLDRVLEDYTDKMVLKTLVLVVDDIRAFEKAAVRLQSDPTDRNLAAAASAWRSARAQWQRTYAFLFGPASQYDFHKQIASFPLDRPLVDHLLGEMEAGRVTVDETFLREQRHATHRGFLAAEYLLFRDGKPRAAAQLGKAELDYLSAVSRAMTLESMDFEASWVGSTKMPADKAALLRAAGMKNRGSYADEFRKPGAPGSRYASHSVSLQEIFQDSISATEDLCVAIVDVLGSDDPRDSETRHSHNGPADLLNTLQSVENAYLGGVPGARRHSISDLLLTARSDVPAARNDVLDRRIKIALADTAYRIAQVGDPYGEPRDDRELLVRRAEAACQKLVARLSTASLLVCTDPATRPYAAYGL